MVCVCVCVCAGALFIKSLGTNPFTITVINACCGIFTGFLAMSLSDRVGRRRLLQLSALIQAGGLFTMGGLGLQSPASSSHKAGEVAMVIVSINGFLLGWAPLTYVVSAEIPALRLRDRTQRAGMLTNIFFNWLVNFIVPYLLNPPYADLQGRVGFIFGSITVLSMLFTFFCVPECKNRSLEEIDIMFQTGVPIRAFRNHTHIAIEVDADKADVDPESPRDRQAAFDEKDAKATTMERDTSEKE
jgi:SP family sugar:H+ symporter-like MFS transporter